MSDYQEEAPAMPVEDDVAAAEARAQAAAAARLTQQRAAIKKAQEARRANAIARKAAPRTAKPRAADDAKVGVMAHPEPATRRNEPTRESYRPEATEQFTRRKRADRGVGNFDLPAHRKKRGWDYQWITISVLNQPVDGARIRDFREGGWRPCLAGDWPELSDLATTSDSPIEMEGQRLMERPMSLTLEARAEDVEIARAAQRDRTLAAASGASAIRGRDDALTVGKGMHRVPVSVEIEELAG